MAINYTKTTWINEQAPAINATNLNKIEQGIKDACDGVDTLTPATDFFYEQKILLWENPSPTSSFAAQTVSLDLSDYDDIRVVFCATITDSSAVSTQTDVGSKAYAQLITGVNQSATMGVMGRVVTTSTSGVTFADGYRHSMTGTTATVINSVLIPYKIYGIKRING